MQDKNAWNFCFWHISSIRHCARDGRIQG